MYNGIPVSMPPQVNRDRERLPDWFRVPKNLNATYRLTEQRITSNGLNTICEEARCPNRWECWRRGIATIMILGEGCTRRCGFCSVSTGPSGPLDPGEPFRVARAVQEMGLSHAVITSVNRDDLPDGGAGAFVQTVAEIRRMTSCTIELLIPDFKGEASSQDLIFSIRPDILNHNTETVPRLYRRVRPQGRYEWTLGLLTRASRSGLVTKSGLMVGLGETRQEIREVMEDLRENGCDILTIGQYLQPSKEQLPVTRYYHPDEFVELKSEALRRGFAYVESGPLVRSSYHADEQVIPFKK